MKKVFSFFVFVAVLVAALGTNVGMASAAGSKVVIYIPGVTQKELKDATIFVGSDFHPTSCALREPETGKVVCNVPGTFGGETAWIHVAGQVFIVKVPQPQIHKSHDAQAGDEALTCTEPEYSGANTAFYGWYKALFLGVYTSGNFSNTVFVRGETLDEVDANAYDYHSYSYLESYLGYYERSVDEHEVVGEIDCSDGGSIEN